MVDINDSIVDLGYNDKGELCKQVVHKDGSCSLVPLKQLEVTEEEAKTLDERFADTKIMPMDWQDPNTKAVEKPTDKTKGKTKDECINAYLRMKAVLVKWTSPRMRDKVTESIHTSDNKMLKLLLEDVIRAMDDEEFKNLVIK